MNNSKFIIVKNTELEDVGIPVDAIRCVKEYKGMSRYTCIYRNDNYKNVYTNESVKDVVAKINAVKW